MNRLRILGAFGGLLLVSVLITILGCTERRTPWTVLPVEILPSVPIPDDEMLLPEDIAAFRNGIVVADNGSRQALVWKGAGYRVSHLGREGAGPGEFRNMAGLAVHGLRGVVTDPRNSRVTILDLQHGVVTSMLPVAGDLADVAMDTYGRLHVSRRGSAGEPGIVVVLDSAGTALRTYGTYEPRNNSMANSFNNDVAIVAGAAGATWLLYRYRGVVEEFDASGTVQHRWTIPLPKGFNNDSAYVKAMDEAGNVVMIIRAPLATDLAIAGDGNVFIAVTSSDETLHTDLLVYSSVGEPRFKMSLPHLIRRIAIRGDTIYALPDIQLHDIRVERYLVRQASRGTP